MSVAAVLPATSALRTSLKRGSDSKTARDDTEGGGSEDTSFVAESWFFGVFGMWFWMINLNFESFWREAGFITRDELDGTVSGVLEIKSLDRSKESSRTYSSYQCLSKLFTHRHRYDNLASNVSTHNHINVNGHSNHAQQHSQRPVAKGRPRERFSNQSGHGNGNRSTTPPPLPKSASLPLHTKRGAILVTPDKSNHASTGSAFPTSRSPPVPQPSLPLTPELLSTSTISSPPPCAISRSPSVQYKSLPAIAELERQIEVSRKATDDLRSQLSDFKKNSESGRTSLRDELEKQRSQKRAEDIAKAELKSRTKALEDQKRSAESARREAEKRLKTACTARDGAEARTKRLEDQIRYLNSQIETQGSEIVKSGLEASALAAELVQQVEERRSEVKLYEEEVAVLGQKVREMEEKIVEEEKRLEKANREADERREKREQERENAHNQVLPREHTLSLPTKPTTGLWQAVSSLQGNHVNTSTDGQPLELSDAFPPSPVAHTTPDSPLSIAPPELLVRRASIPSALPLSIPVQNSASNSTVTGNASSTFSLFNPDFPPPTLHQPRQIGPNVPIFSPFNDVPLSPGFNAIASPLSPSSELLIPSSLYRSLGMPDGGISPSSVEMDRNLSRSFQSDDDVILDKDWLAKRNRSAVDVGVPNLAPGTAEASPISPSGSVRGDFPDFDPFETRAPGHERFASLRMDTQRASFAQRPFTSEFSPQQVILDPVVPLEEHSRRSAWFSKDKNKDGKEKGKENGTHKTKEKKGLNPDAKEFSLSKDKERSFFASLRNKGSTTPNSGSGSSSTPSTASSITTPEMNLTPFPTSNNAAVSPPHNAAKAVPSLFGLGSSWFSSSRAFAPTPTEREQLARVLGGSSNASLDHLSNVGDVASLPNSPQPKTAIAQPIAVSQLADIGKGRHLWMTGGAKSVFNPFIDDASSSSSGAIIGDKMETGKRRDGKGGSGSA